MAFVRVKDNESFEQAMRRWKRAVEKSGILSEVRKRERFVAPSQKKQRDMAAAIKRHRKKQQREGREFEDSGHGGRRGGARH